jgi:alpha-1,6-mannosyltransferase
MASDATTLPLRDSLLDDPCSAPRRATWRRGGAPVPGELPGAARTRTRREAALGASALVTIAVCVTLVVVAAADRPSFLSAPTHYGFFPGWMAGPLGGLWPWFTRSPQAIKSLFTAALLVMYVAYLVGLRYVPTLRARWAVATVVGVHVVLLLSPPLSLTDVFNYINYGRMGMLHHLNPYTTIPVLEPHSDPSYALSNWHQLLSPYGPAFTLLTYAVVPLGLAASLWTLKSLVAVASLGTILLVWRCARLLDRDPVQAIVFVGLNPIVLVWGLGGDHNDFFMVFLIVLAFYLLLRARAPGISPELDVSTEPDRVHGVRWEQVRGWLWPLAPAELAAGLALASAIALKASAGILVPVVLAGLLRAPRRLVQVVVGIVAGGAVWGVCSVVAFGFHLPNLGTQGRLVIPMSLPNVVGLVLGQGGETTTMRVLLSVVLALSVLGCSVLAWRRRDALSASGWATVALLVTLSWVLPWYVLWVLPLAALSRSRALRRTTLALGAYLILTWMPSATAMDNAVGLRPTKTSLGQSHQLEVKRLLN